MVAGVVNSVAIDDPDPVGKSIETWLDAGAVIRSINKGGVVVVDESCLFVFPVVNPGAVSR